MSEEALSLLFCLAHYVYCMTARQASRFLFPRDTTFQRINRVIDELLRADPKRPFIEKQFVTLSPPEVLLRAGRPISHLAPPEERQEDGPIRIWPYAFSNPEWRFDEPPGSLPGPKAIVRFLKKHRRPREVKRFPILVARDRGAALVGGVPGRIAKPGQLWHDLHAAEVTVAEAFFPIHFHICRVTDLYRNLYYGREAREYHEALRRRWRGEGWLVAHRLSVDGYYPDAAIVGKDKIIAAVETGSPEYPVQRIREIITACESTKVLYAIW
jgi:hypothetical protein